MRPSLSAWAAASLRSSGGEATEAPSDGIDAVGAVRAAGAVKAADAVSAAGATSRVASKDVTERAAWAMSDGDGRKKGFKGDGALSVSTALEREGKERDGPFNCSTVQRQTRKLRVPMQSACLSHAPFPCPFHASHASHPMPHVHFTSLASHPLNHIPCAPHIPCLDCLTHIPPHCRLITASSLACDARLTCVTCASQDDLCLPPIPFACLPSPPHLISPPIQWMPTAHIPSHIPTPHEQNEEKEKEKEDRPIRPFRTAL